MEAFAEADLDPYFYSHRERDLEETLPWDHIDSGISKRFLIREWKRAQAGQVTQIAALKAAPDAACARTLMLEMSWWGERDQVKIRARFTKEEPVRFISHLDLARTVERAVQAGRLAGGLQPGVQSQAEDRLWFGIGIRDHQ